MAPIHFYGMISSLNIVVVIFLASSPTRNLRRVNQCVAGIEIEYLLGAVHLTTAPSCTTAAAAGSRRRSARAAPAPFNRRKSPLCCRRSYPIAKM
ncbi:hypothetical protein EVAR_65461_1 [Eumeta japonica]|uniref:Uncharacterized protein n=1 Tax=Eumeta variegata TaxID=151549 RepID=A0A4C1YWF7_EUMVA|nr:hypothetical protein EVAR_65461_1 [Eumeta japonica]